jgi:hypothetical protein
MKAAKIGRNQSIRLKILDWFTRSAANGVGVAPLDGTELGFSEEGVGDADGSDRLVPILYVGIMRIPL